MLSVLFQSVFIVFTTIEKGTTMYNDNMQTHYVKNCLAEGCDQEARNRGMCSKHYQQMRRHGRLTPEREYRKRGMTCEAEGCSEGQVARGYCFRHYQQLRRVGRLTPERERTYGRTHCSYPGCSKPHSARDFCKKHYMSEYYYKVLTAEKSISNAAGGG